jgi:ABC-2 type transport system permease protein
MKFLHIKRNYLDLLWQLIKTNFKMRYQNSLLGVLWVLIKPYSTFIVLYFIWSGLGQARTEKYPLYLLIGIVFYTYFNELVVYGQNALLEKAHIILKVSFPRQIAIISSLFNAVINLGINLILILIIAVATGNQLTLGGIIFFLFLSVLVFVFSLGLSFFLSILTVRLRDLKNIMELGLFLLYWATPVFYVLDSGLLGGNVAKLIGSSPVTLVINQARAALGIYAEMNWGLMTVYLLISFVFLLIGWAYFSNQVKRIAEYF